MNDNAKVIAGLTREQLELVRLRLNKIEKRDNESAPRPILRQSKESNLFPLSFAQQRLWFIDQMTPGNVAYNIPAVVRLSGPLDVNALERSFNEIVRRHEILRTSFRTAGERQFQEVAPSLELSIDLKDLTMLGREERESEAMRLTAWESRQPFDLTRGNLLRVTLIRLAERDHIMLRTIHHIISDKISQDIFVNELLALYSAFASGRPSPLTELPIQYADFACWQREWLQGGVLQSQLSYWKETLANAAPLLKLPTDFPRPAVQSFRGARQMLECPASLLSGLEALSQQVGCTLFMTLLTALKALLYHYSAQQDVSVGTTISGRHRTETEGLIGLFVNTLVLRTSLSDDPTFVELLRRVREVVLGAEAHQYLPFERLVEELQIERDPGCHPLFQIIFNLQNTAPVTTGLPELNLTPMEANNGTVKFDMAIFLTKMTNGIVGQFFYNTDLFRAPTIARMIEDYKTLLSAVVESRNETLTNLLNMVDRENQRREQSQRNELKKSNLEKLRAGRRKAAGRPD